MRSLLLSAIVLFCTASFGAPSEASWSGVLRDNSGTAVAGATVTLTDISGKTTYTAQTKAGGEFIFSAIAPLI